MKKEITPSQKALNLWAIILIVWSVFRAYFKTDLPIWLDEFIIKPFVFVLPVYIYITKFEKKDFCSSIGLKCKDNKLDILLGIGIGLLFFLSAQLASFVKSGHLNFSLSSILYKKDLIILVFISVMTSISEEILSRGFVLKRLYEESKNIFTSSFLASILFFFLHVPMLFTSSNITGVVLLQVMFTDLILSFAVSILFIERKNLLLPILVHAIYNLNLYLFI